MSAPFPEQWTSPHGRALPVLGEKLVWMGILNATPDSFSDGGRFLEPQAARAQAEKLINDGAQILDIGAESTRPGFEEISADEEWARLAPVLKTVRAAFPQIAISIDTYKAQTARRAIEAGADIVNDIWGLKKSADMAATIADLNCPVILMHNRAAPPTGDLWQAVFDDLDASLALAQAAGIKRNQCVLDVGIGFGKTVAQQLECLRNGQRMRRWNLPVLLGPSRKSALSKTVGTELREEATAAAIVWSLAKDACDIVRVHDVAAMRKFVKIAEELASAPPEI